MKPEPSPLDAILQDRQGGGGVISPLDEEGAELVIFQIDQDLYACGGASVREILSQVEIFFVPGCMASMEGVINVRGDIETVINLSDTLGPKAGGYAASWAILLGRAGGMQSGIRVDKVVDVLVVPKSAIQQAPATLPARLQAAVSGVMRYRELPVTVLSLERIFEACGRSLA